MNLYKSDLKQFRMRTPLILFCNTQKRFVEPPQDFQKVIAKFSWPSDGDVTLEDVEQFRERYACHYHLRPFAIMIFQVRPGSFIITWVVPRSIIAKLEANIPRDLLKQYDVIKLEIGGSCVYDVYSKVYIDSLSDLPLDDAVREKLENSKQLSVLVTGCYGVGKSTLINSLFYKKGGKYVPLADEGSLEPCTTEVNQYVLEIEGTTFNFYDSPGLQDNNDLIHLRLIQTTCPNIHLLIYCSKLDEPVRPAEFEALDNITKTFGMSVWDNALTFANMVDSPDPDIDEAEFFKERMEEKLQEAFEGLCIKPEAPQKLKMRTYPAGSAKVLQLPGMGEDWKAEFWYGCIEACREEGKGAAFKMAWKDPAFLMKVVGASLSTATGAAGAAGGAGCVIAGIALTATGILAPVGIALIVGGAVGGLLGVGATAGGATTIRGVIKGKKKDKQK